MNLTPEALGYVSLGLLFLVVVVIAAVRIARGKRLTPDQLEEKRRNWLSTAGKLGGGAVTDVQGDLVSYTYDVRGISYNATQDCATLQQLLPEDRWSIIGGVGVRYDPRNPANSIVVSESWSGLRKR